MVGQSTQWLTGLLLLAIAALGAVVVLELTDGVAIAPEVTAAAPAITIPETRPEPAEFQPPPERQFEEISSRPLFFPSRRPFASPAAPSASDVAPAADPAVDLVLIGILLTERERAALVQPNGQPGAHWVREQQTIAGWLVEEIDTDRVQLREGDRVEVVKLRADQARAASQPKRKRKSASPKESETESAEQTQAAPVQ